VCKEASKQVDINKGIPSHVFDGSLKIESLPISQQLRAPVQVLVKHEMTLAADALTLIIFSHSLQLSALFFLASRRINFPLQIDRREA